MTGQAFIWGKDRESARALLSAADRLGYDPGVVATTDNGFVVPTDVAEAAAPMMGGDPQPQQLDPHDPF